MHARFLARALLLALIVPGCNQPAGRHRYGEFPPDTRSQVTIQQGIWGNVWFWEGDFMPPGWGTITPVSRTVYAYELTSGEQVEQVPYSPFYRSIRTRLVALTSSNSTGFFQMALPPGSYSIFVREDSLYYANLTDSMGNIMPATVRINWLTKVQIDITYKASF